MKNSTQNLFVIGLLILGVFLVGMVTYYNQPEPQLSERNYEGELMLGIIPNVPSRVPLQNDVLLGYVKSKSGDTFGLFESNYLETKDFKGIFAYQVN